MGIKLNVETVYNTTSYPNHNLDIEIKDQRYS